MSIRCLLTLSKLSFISSYLPNSYAFWRLSIICLKSFLCLSCLYFHSFFSVSYFVSLFSYKTFYSSIHFINSLFSSFFSTSNLISLFFNKIFYSSIYFINSSFSSFFSASNLLYKHSISEHFLSCLSFQSYTKASKWSDGSLTELLIWLFISLAYYFAVF